MSDLTEAERATIRRLNAELEAEHREDCGYCSDLLAERAALLATRDRLEAEVAMYRDATERLGITRGKINARDAWWWNDRNNDEPCCATLAEAAEALWTEYRALAASRDRYEAALRWIAARRCNVALGMGLPYPERAENCSCDSCVAREALADEK